MEISAGKMLNGIHLFCVIFFIDAPKKLLFYSRIAPPSLLNDTFYFRAFTPR